MGFQITSAKLSNVGDYGVDQINAYYKGLVDADDQLINPDTEVAAEVKHGEYFDKTVSDVANEYTKENGKIETAVKALKKDATVKEKLEAIDKVVEEGKKAIDEKYTKVLKDAKVKATKALKALQTTVTSKYFKAADKASLLESQTAAIEACTTLSSLTSLVNNKTNVTNEKKAENGSLNTSYDLKKKSFNMVEQGLNTVITAEPSLKDNKSDAYKATVAGLAAWGVSVDSLPSEIAQGYFDQISEAESFEVYNQANTSIGAYKGDPVLGVTGKNAVTKSLKDLKTALVDAITKSYRDEIANSEKITDSTVKTTLDSLVVRAKDEWVAKVKSNTASELDLSSRGDALADYYGTKSTVSGSYTLINTLEAALNGRQGSVLLQQERLDNAKKSVKATLLAQKDAILAADPIYAEAQSYVYKSSEATNKYTGIASNKLGNDDEINNFLFGALEPDSSTGTWVAASADAQFNVSEKYANLTSKSEGGLNHSGIESVEDVLDFKTNHINDLTIVYLNAVHKLATELKGKSSFTSDLEFVPLSSVDKAWSDSIYTNGVPTKKFQEVYDLYDSLEASTQLLTDLNTGLKAWFSTSTEESKYRFDREAINLRVGFDGTKLNSTGGDYSVIRASISSMVKGIVAGTISSAEVANFVSIDTMNTLYDQEVEEYKAAALEALDTYVAGVLEDITSVELSQKVKDAKAIYAAALGNYLYNNSFITPEEYEALSATEQAKCIGNFLGETMANVDSWLTAAKIEIPSGDYNAVIDTITQNGGGAIETDDGTSVDFRADGVARILTGIDTTEDSVNHTVTTTIDYKLAGTPSTLTEEQANAFWGAANGSSHFGEKFVIINIGAFSIDDNTKVYYDWNLEPNGTPTEAVQDWVEDFADGTLILSIHELANGTHDKLTITIEQKVNNVTYKTTYNFDLTTFISAQA